MKVVKTEASDNRYHATRNNGMVRTYIYSSQEPFLRQNIHTQSSILYSAGTRYEAPVTAEVGYVCDL